MIESGQSIGMAAMFMVGLMGAGHCAGMCGGIVTGLGLASQGQKSTQLVYGYNIGRITSYTLAGLLVGSLSYWGHTYLALGPALRFIAGVLLILMGLYLAGWSNLLVALEKIGSRGWRYLQPLGKHILPVTNFKQALLLGMLWGWLPCGLVYSALAYAATATTPWQGALMMTAFGLGTAPAMLVGGFFSERARQVLQRPTLRRVMALVLIAFGVWIIAKSLGLGFLG